MPKPVYRIHFKRADAELEVEGDKKFVTKHYNEFKASLGREVAAKPTLLPEVKAGRGSAASKSEIKPASPREFLDRYALKRHVDIVLAFGYFLEKSRSLKSFSAVDVNACYYEAKIEPSNTSQMIINNIKKGFMMQAQRSGAKRTYMLTRTGEQFVNDGFKTSKSK